MNVNSVLGIYYVETVSYGCARPIRASVTVLVTGASDQLGQVFSLRVRRVESRRTISRG